MKKTVKRLSRIVLFLAAFGVAAYWAMPWGQVGEYIFSNMAKKMSQQGSSLSYTSVSASGNGFTVEDVAAKGLIKFSFKSLTVTPDLLGSLFNLAPTSRVSFTQGAFQMSQPLLLGNGRMTAMLRPDEIFLENLRTDGDFSVNGFVGIAPAQGRISRAEASIKVSENLESDMELLKGFLPLVKEAQGRWVLRRQKEAALKK